MSEVTNCLLIPHDAQHTAERLESTGSHGSVLGWHQNDHGTNQKGRSGAMTLAALQSCRTNCLY